MRKINSHSLVVYSFGYFLILAPLLFGFVSDDRARNISMITGATLIVLKVIFSAWAALFAKEAVDASKTADLQLSIPS